LVTRWREPGGPGVRNDSGIEQGWQVPGDYDPMLAKVLAVAPDRDLALARARRAVDEFETGGVQTTLPFHAWLLAHPEFTEARLRTDMVARDWEPEPLRAAAAERAAAAVARHVWSSHSAPAGDAGTESQTCRDHGTGWKPEPWA
jgi:acetyl-CoA carboxylase biotin carboxylase subunit